MFDYVNLDRPVVIHIDDWDAYEAARGTYFDVRSFPRARWHATRTT